MGQNTLNGNTYCNGNFSAASMTLPQNSVADSQVVGSANIDGYKLKHFHRRVYSQASGVAASSESRVVHLALNTGVITDFWAGCVTIPVGADTVTVDLKKNGTSVLSAPITLTNGNASRVAVSGTITTIGVVAGDVLEIVITANHSTGTLPQEVFAAVNLNEQSEG